MADKKIQPSNPTVEAKKAEDPKAAELAERKTATRSRRVSGRKVNGFHGA